MSRGLQQPDSPAKQRSQWSPPRVHIADTVIFRSGIGSEPLAAIVTEVGSNAVSLSVFSPNANGAKNVQSVRHIDDPLNNTIPPRDGVWELSEQTRYRIELQSVEADSDF